MKLYIVIPADYDSTDEVMVFFANSREEAFDRFAEKEGQSPEIREFVQDRGCNCSLSEKFWFTDDDRYMFEPVLNDEWEVVPRRDIQARFLFDKKKVDEYLDKQYESNVKEFFKHDDTGLADDYLSYMRETTEELPEHIYKYVAKWDQDWRHVDIREIEIPKAAMI